MRRKDIQRLIETWFEISGPSITRELRAMMRPPLSLVRMTEDPDSGREKMVILTAKGERFLATMIEQGIQFLRPLMRELSPEEISNGMTFLQRGTQIIQRAQIGTPDGLNNDDGSARKPLKRQRKRGKGDGSTAS